MQAFGRMRLDVENCLKELVEFGVVRRVAGDPVRYTAARLDATSALGKLLDTFLERRAAVGIEDTSPSVQRFRELIGRDEKMLAIFEWIRTAAKSDISVLILGPTGAGKEVVARMIHELSRRGTEKFQAVNCAALPDTLFESEIFGYEKGAFTGAHERKPGRLELANGGTFFLDEVGDLSLVAQAKILRVLEERRFERLGGSKSIHVDFRLISATNRPLDQFVRESRFREDLFYRVNAFSIRLPSLKERAVDIPVLAARFIARYCAANGLPLDAKQLSPEATDRLLRYHWPGNIRELESTMSRAALSAPGPLIRAEDIEFLHEPAGARPRAPRAACRRCATTNGPTSPWCSTPSAGTSSKRPGCSTSAAARSTARSRSTAWSPPRGRRRREPVSAVTAHARAPPVRQDLHHRRHRARARRCWRTRVLEIRLDNPYLFVALLLLSSVTSAFKVALPLSASGSTMSVSYAVDFASLLLLGPAQTTVIAVTSAWSQCTFRMRQADLRLPHALQHGVPGDHGAGRRLGLPAARRRARARSASRSPSRPARWSAPRPPTSCSTPCSSRWRSRCRRASRGCRPGTRTSCGARRATSSARRRRSAPAGRC